MEDPADAPVLEGLKRLLALYRADPHMEMEVRLGRIENDQFIPTVAHDYAMALYKAMTDAESAKQWDASFDVKFTDKYFEGNVRGRYMSKDPNGVFHRIAKSDTLDVRCPQNLYALRFSLKSEEPLRGFKTSSPATLVRCSRRSTIRHGLWTYDFTQTVQGRTTDEACQSPFVIGVELELQRDETYLANTPDDTIAINFLGKARDLLGRFTHAGLEVPVPVEVLAYRVFPKEG